MGERALVADDDPKQTSLIKLYLEREGFAVDVVHDGRSALKQAAVCRPDIAVIDVMMPEIDGLDVCRRLMGEHGIPVVLVTARSTENDILLGLYLGADDYLTKPFSPRELVARVRTVLRRVRRSEPATTLVAGPLTLDAQRHEVTVNGALVDCTPVEFSLLWALAERPGQVLSRRQLLERLHGGAEFMTERTVDSHILNLRRKVEPSPGRPELVLTVYGVGYKLTDTAPGATAGYAGTQ